MTKDRVPVYNVSLPLLARAFPDQARFRLIELPVEQPTPEPVEGRR
jgi:hypothetical protein